jgi:hypothetical protein
MKSARRRHAHHVRVSEVLFQPDEIIYRYSTGQRVQFDQHTGAYRVDGHRMGHEGFEVHHPELAHAMREYNRRHRREYA